MKQEETIRNLYRINKVLEQVARDAVTELTRYRAAMKMAVKALKFHEDYDGCEECMKVLTALRDALKEGS